MTIHATHPFADPEPDPARRFRGRLGGTATLWTAGARRRPGRAHADLGAGRARRAGPGARAGRPRLRPGGRGRGDRARPSSSCWAGRTATWPRASPAPRRRPVACSGRPIRRHRVGAAARARDHLGRRTPRGAAARSAGRGCSPAWSSTSRSARTPTRCCTAAGGGCGLRARSGLGAAATQNWLPSGSVRVTQRNDSSPRRSTSPAPAASSRSTSASRSSAMRSTWSLFLPGVGSSTFWKAICTGPPDTMRKKPPVRVVDLAAELVGPPLGERDGVGRVDGHGDDAQGHAPDPRDGRRHRLEPSAARGWIPA